MTSIKSFSKELTTSFLTFDDDPSSPTFQQLVPGIRSVGKVEIGLMAAVFILMSAVAHAWVLVFWKTCKTAIRTWDPPICSSADPVFASCSVRPFRHRARD